MTVIARFAPSPTGFLHIGGARTALFNWLYARHYGGKFYLRIEDTDRERSSQEAVDKILDGLQWLGLDWDEEPIFQSTRSVQHAEIVQQLLERSHAYCCYCTPEELTGMRDKAAAEGKAFKYDGSWRDRLPQEAPPDRKPAIRLKAPKEGETRIQDLVQGEVVIQNTELDDMVLLRSDGTPTYMLAVVVDDHDMGITHIIRGDDHLTNAARQIQLYQAMGWEAPRFAHIPLIHGQDGAKLSKRHGALGVEAYREMGYLPEAVCNYLLRLGWSHGNDEIISREQAIEWFDLDAVGRSASRFDMEKLNHLNAYYLRQTDNQKLAELIAPGISDKLGRALNPQEISLLARAMPGLKERTKTLTELIESSLFYLQNTPLPFTEKARALLTKENLEILRNFSTFLEKEEVWTAKTLEQAITRFLELHQLKLGQLAQPLRAVLTGSTTSPGIYEVMEVLGKGEVLKRLTAAIGE